MVEGNTHHRYKEAMTLLEERSPGTKHQFYAGFLKKASNRFSEESEEVSVVACDRCGAPTAVWDRTSDPICSFCKTKALAERRKTELSRGR